MRKIRIGIELDHVIRDVNRQIAKCYQSEYDESLDIDDIDYKDDVLHTVCKFNSRKEEVNFLYEDYPLEIYGHANQIDRFLSRDLNLWIKKLENQEKYDVEVFFYSLFEHNITIQSTYFFLSKIASRVRKVVFPKDIEELWSLGDIFVTSNASVVDFSKKPTILIRMNFNRRSEDNASIVYDDFRSFLNDNEKMKKICKALDKRKKGESTISKVRSFVCSLFKKKN